MSLDYNTEHSALGVNVKLKTNHTNQIGISVLIVDDSLLIVNNIKELLEDVEGIASVESCGTYAEAIHLLCTRKPALVLLDINLPDKNGIVLLKHIKTFYPEVSVIMVTNQYADFYK